MPILTRRDAIKGIVAGSTGLAMGAEGSTRQSSEAAQVARAFRGQHQPKPLPFDPAKLTTTGLGITCTTHR